MNQNKPVLLFYCQHSLGMGHLVRALTLAQAFAEKFAVVFINGGRFPDNIAPPDNINVVNIPPLGMAEDNSLYSQDALYSLEQAQALRRQLILDTFTHYCPAVVLIELFPFGRKKFAGELLPLLKAANRRTLNKPLVLCSLRDIMVNARKDQLRHDNRARWLIERYFDGVLVHSDPSFANLEQSFQPSRPLTKPVHYTGFVLPKGSALNTVRERSVLVSAGGGMVGAPLFYKAINAQRILWIQHKLPMTLVAGPFLPEQDWLNLQQQAAISPGLTLYRSVPNMAELLASHAVSVSQGGYNTVMDILKSGIPALILPFSQGQEVEQTNRAERLSKLGLVRTFTANGISGEQLAVEIEQMLEFIPNKSALDLNGANRTVEILDSMLISETNIPSQPGLSKLETAYV
jgi:predicted glycosyltransferase